MKKNNQGIPGIGDVEEIGRGGFGVVYRATEEELGRDVAVKVLTGTVDDRTRSRFERECRAMGALSGHPHIVTIYRSGTTEAGLLYLVMEYLHGGSLADQIDASGPATWQEALRTGIELSGALESAHRAGVLHRDVKPGNVLMDDLGRAMLGDFGIARLDGGPETKSSVITASVAHAPPEVIGGQRPDERSDIYSLASTLFHLINGSAAFVRDSDESMLPLFARIAHDPVPDLRDRGVPEAFTRTLEQAMSKEASTRYGSAEALGQALVAVQRELGESETQLWISGETSNRPAANTTVQVAPPEGDQPPPPRQDQVKTSADISEPLPPAPVSQPATPPAPQSDAAPQSDCLLYTSPSPRDQRGSRMPSSA